MAGDHGHDAHGHHGPGTMNYDEIRKYAFVGAKPAVVDNHAYFKALQDTALGSPKTYQRISDRAYAAAKARIAKGEVKA